MLRREFRTRSMREGVRAGVSIPGLFNESEFRPALELLELSSSSSSEQGSSRKRRELDPVHGQARGEAHIVPYGFARSCGPPQVRDRASRNAEQFGDRGMGFSASRCSLCIPLSNLIVFYGFKQRTGSICGSRRGPRLRGRREADSMVLAKRGPLSFAQMQCSASRLRILFRASRLSF